jgi:hypothetical protein
MTALFQSTKPSIIQIRELADGLKNHRESDRAAGDDAAVQSSLDLQLQLARQLPHGGFMVDAVVGMVLEKRVLQEMDTPEARARLEEMDRQKTSMMKASAHITALMETGTVSEHDWSHDFDRTKLFGEQAANIWLLERHPPP